MIPIQRKLRKKIVRNGKFESREIIPRMPIRLPSGNAINRMPQISALSPLMMLITSTSTFMIRVDKDGIYKDGI